MDLCAFEGCQKERRRGRYCLGHRGQHARGEPLRPLQQQRSRTEVAARACDFAGCKNKTQLWNRLCAGHRHQKRRGEELRPLRPRKLNAETFAYFVDQTGDCWVWRGDLTGDGYGRFGGHRPGISVLAHRLSWEMHVGPIPPGLDVLQRCDNPPCVNPAHLFLGTQADNNADRLRKGRYKKMTISQPAQPEATLVP